MQIQLVSIGITTQGYNDLQTYCSKIEAIIGEYQGFSIFVLPEYCWGDTVSHDEIKSAISLIQRSLKEKQFLLAGSYPTLVEKKQYNTTNMYDKDRLLKSTYKTHVLSDEGKRNNVVSGKNTEILEIEGLKIAIIICADIWDNTLLNSLIKKNEADILLIPAFTVVPKGFSKYAQTQWHSLAVVRSREYLVPIVVADHSQNGENYDVGAASCIVDPSKKQAGMDGFADFLYLPKNNVAATIIDLDKVNEYREYRIKKGLFSEKII